MTSALYLGCHLELHSVVLGSMGGSYSAAIVSVSILFLPCPKSTNILMKNDVTISVWLSLCLTVTALVLNHNGLGQQETPEEVNPLLQTTFCRINICAAELNQS